MSNKRCNYWLIQSIYNRFKSIWNHWPTWPILSRVFKMSYLITLYIILFVYVIFFFSNEECPIERLNRNPPLHIIIHYSQITELIIVPRCINFFYRILQFSYRYLLNGHKFNTKIFALTNSILNVEWKSHDYNNEISK